MEDRRWTGFILSASLYFPEAYSKRLHMSVLRGIRGFAEDSILTICPTDLPTAEVSSARVGDTDIRGHPMELRWDDQKIESVIGRSYVAFVKFKLRESGRPVTVMTFLYDNANVLFDIDFTLTEEESTAEGPLVPEDIGESRLLDVIDSIDPFWAVVSVEGMAPDIEALLGHEPGTLWDGIVYLGSLLTKRVGRKRLQDALSELASVTDLGHGGVYLSWTPPHKLPDPGHERFLALLREVVQSGRQA